MVNSRLLPLQYSTETAHFFDRKLFRCAAATGTAPLSSNLVKTSSAQKQLGKNMLHMFSIILYGAAIANSVTLLCYSLEKNLFELSLLLLPLWLSQLTSCSPLNTSFLNLPPGHDWLVERASLDFESFQRRRIGRHHRQISRLEMRGKTLCFSYGTHRVLIIYIL